MARGCSPGIFDRVADGEWRDPTVEEPVARITTILQDLKDLNLVERHALWLLQKDPDAGLRVREAFPCKYTNFTVSIDLDINPRW